MSSVVNVSVNCRRQLVQQHVCYSYGNSILAKVVQKLSTFICLGFYRVIFRTVAYLWTTVYKGDAATRVNNTTDDVIRQ